MQDFEEHEGGPASSPRRVGLLLAAVVAVAVVLFSLGVMVGKKAHMPAPEIVDPPTALPTETLVPLSPEDLPAASTGRSEDGGAGPGAAPAQKLTFFDRLSGEGADEPALPKRVEKTPPAAPPAAAEKAAPEPAREPPPARAAAEGRGKRPPQASPASRIAELSSGGPWAVQVSSGTNRVWSDDYVGKLKKRGLEARSVAVMLDGKRWYRIRIGRFPDRATAREARQILESGLDLKGNVVQGD